MIDSANHPRIAALAEQIRSLEPVAALRLFETLEELAVLVWDLHDQSILDLPEVQAEIHARSHAGEPRSSAPINKPVQTDIIKSER